MIAVHNTLILPMKKMVSPGNSLNPPSPGTGCPSRSNGLCLGKGRPGHHGVRWERTFKGEATEGRKWQKMLLEPFLNGSRQAKISLKINHVGYLCLCLYSGLRHLRSPKSFTCFFHCWQFLHSSSCSKKDLWQSEGSEAGWSENGPPHLVVNCG